MLFGYAEGTHKTHGPWTWTTAIFHRKNTVGWLLCVYEQTGPF